MSHLTQWLSIEYTTQHWVICSQSWVEWLNVEWYIFILRVIVELSDSMLVILRLNIESSDSTLSSRTNIYCSTLSHLTQWLSVESRINTYHSTLGFWEDFVAKWLVLLNDLLDGCKWLNVESEHWVSVRIYSQAWTCVCILHCKDLIDKLHHAINVAMHA